MRTLALLLLLLFSLERCFLQKPNTDSNRRHDVYIAGFFPYGRGVENSETGEDFFVIDGKRVDGVVLRARGDAERQASSRSRKRALGHPQELQTAHVVERYHGEDLKEFVGEGC